MDSNETSIVMEGHVIQVWLPSIAPRTNEVAEDKAGSCGVRWALFSHMPKPETEAEETQERVAVEGEGEGGEGEKLLLGVPVASPKPGSAKIEI